MGMTVNDGRKVAHVEGIGCVHFKVKHEVNC
jgi:hypothetical protein